MLFFSPIFLFCFLPIVFFLFFAARGLARDLVLIIASCAFYFWAEPRFFPVAMLSTIIDFFLCQLIFKLKGTKQAKLLLTAGIILNVLMLVYYKYMDFFVGNANSILQVLHWQPLPLLQIALPIGVSFIVFEKITYLVDVYKNKGLPAKSLKHYFLYIFLFPKLLAGPIVKYHDIAAQLTNHKTTLDDFFYGFRRFLLGLVKKMLLADTLAQAVDMIFAVPPDQLNASQAWLGMICFSFQVYLDFSAYSDMAIGLARMFGFRLMENFNMPLISHNITEFWKRWHISLSTWVRDYLYLPMTLRKKGKGKKRGKFRSYANLFICFLILGLWHGAHWNFVLYGAYSGAWLIIDKLFWISISERLPRVLTIAFTFFLYTIGGVIFRCTSISQIGQYYTTLFTPGREGTYLYFTNNIWLALLVAALISFIPASSWYKGGIKTWQSLKSSLILENWALSAITLLGIMRAVTSTFNPFLYFRF